MFKRMFGLAAMLAFASACTPNPAQVSNIRIYVADTIVLMTDEGETAEAVAVGDGIIGDVGTLASLQAKFPSAITDETFRGKTIVPGLIDPHMHVVLGGIL